MVYFQNSLQEVKKRAETFTHGEEDITEAIENYENLTFDDDE
jgi:hypothetical protein